MSGTVAYLRLVYPAIHIVSCEPETSLMMARSVAAGHLVELESLPMLSDDNQVLRGRMDVVIIQQRLWVVLVEAKHFGFSVLQAISQTWAYMMGNPDPQEPTCGLITTGEDFLFLKLQRQPSAQYALSSKFTLLSDKHHNLYAVARILKRAYAWGHL